MDVSIHYSIKETDTFDEDHYPQAAREVACLHSNLREIKSAQKTDIIISLLKDHSIKAELLDGNNRLATMLTSGFLRTSHLKSLFTSGKHNEHFLSGLERYIITRLA